VHVELHAEGEGKEDCSANGRGSSDQLPAFQELQQNKPESDIDDCACQQGALKSKDG
jgi:hypothetical protein